MKKQMNLILIALLVIALSSCYTTYKITTSESDAEIFIDSEPKGRGTVDSYDVKEGRCVTVKVEKAGFLTSESRHCYDGVTFGSPKIITVNLVPDESYTSSMQSDFANKDFEQQVSSKLSAEESWKIVSQVVTSYFDNLEMADQLTGYMKTSWQVKSFSNKTIRTRVIVKQSSIEPLKYKLKIVSEYSDNPSESVKNDDKFKEWDRILRTYNELINEFQARLGGK